MVLEAAINGAADALVSFNRQDFGARARPVRHRAAVTPGGLEEAVTMKKQLSTYPLRLPTSLKAAIAEISKADGTSINQFVATAVAEKVSAMRTAEFFTGRAAQADVEAARRLLRREGGQTPELEDQFE